MEASIILKKYFPNISNFKIIPIENGLINTTFLVEENSGQKKYILQKINTSIFKNPKAIVENHCTINTLLQQNGYTKQRVEIYNNSYGELITLSETGNAWRLMSFIENSTTLLKVSDTKTVEKIAAAFSEFYKFINQNPLPLQEVLPNFLDFDLRMKDFFWALEHGNPSFIAKAQPAIEFIKTQINLPNQWIDWQKKLSLPNRIIHADPKISNILLDKHENPICIIDLDTVMNGTLLYDFGDMVRSYTNKLEEDNPKNIDNFDSEIFLALKHGFLQHLENVLEKIELDNMDYAAQIVIYIQAVRFLTDYLNGSVYYTIQRENHNLERAINQINLLKGLQQFLQK